MTHHPRLAARVGAHLARGEGLLTGGRANLRAYVRRGTLLALLPALRPLGPDWRGFF